jgi:hypothetical protein
LTIAALRSSRPENRSTLTKSSRVHHKAIRWSP